MSIDLIVGPSSVGKSTYINKYLDSDIKVIFASNLVVEAIPKDRCVVHYNLFRTVDNNIINYEQNASVEGKDGIVVQKLLDFNGKIQVCFIVANKVDLIKRALARTKEEPIFQTRAKDYPSAKFVELILGVDLKQEYVKWVDLFRRKNIPFKFIHSDKNKFTDVSESDAYAILSSEKFPDYTKYQIESILLNYKFEYQKIELPHNCTTSGSSRKSTADFIFPKSMTMDSVLDIGSAYGYFCFEAEKRGARAVMGVELKKHRFEGANVLKHILGSKVNFVCKNILSEKHDVSADIVLLLNVIHHLPFPLFSFDLISQYCKKMLIMEFPTLRDPKFGRTMKTGFGKKQGPYIGVSLLGKQDQTYLFSESALERILVKNNNYFRSIKFYDSPISKERRIAICMK